MDLSNKENLKTLPIQQIDASIIICTYTEERWDDLMSALASVESQSVHPREIIVVVDHNPAMAERLRGLSGPAQVLESIGIQGISGARNTGLGSVEGSFVIFLDDDAVVGPGWLKAIADVFEDESVLGVGGSIFPSWDEGRPGWFPEEFDWVIGCTFRGMAKTRSEVGRVIGANMAFRREVFHRIGGFNSSIGRSGGEPLAGEETEFCTRVLGAFPGGRLVFEPLAQAWQRVPSQRSCWRYFSSRCYAEGLSKARVSKSVGAKPLSFEGSYALRTLPLGVARNLGGVLFKREVAGLLRAGAIASGLAITTAGFMRGMMVEAGPTGQSDADRAMAGKDVPT